MKSISFSLGICSLLVFSSIFAKDYKGAELRTIESFTYGRFEVRYMPPAGEGVLGTFFTYHEISNTSEWNEIDIEILGRYSDDVQFTTIIPNQIWRNSHQYVDFDPHADFHVYAFEWTPTYVAWFVDGVEIYRQTDSKIATLSRDQKIMMNIWNPSYEDWVGIWSDNSLPFFAYYDWVSYYEYTPGTGDYGTENNFSHKWTDDFNVWDQSRWEKATHTWSGNNCDFVMANAVFKDGMMILCLTDDTNLGFQDKVKPTAKWVRFASDTLVEGKFSEKVHRITAETISKYSIPGTSILSANLGPDEQTFQLTISPIDTANSYYLVLLGIKDLPPGNNTQIGQNISIFNTSYLNFPTIIDVGSDVDNSGLIDQFWHPDKAYGRMDGQPYHLSPGIDIQNTEMDHLYLSGAKNLVKYNLRVPKGIYKLTLYFAEPEFTQSQERLFDIYVQGQKIVEDLDLFAEAGFQTAHEIVVDNLIADKDLIEIKFTSILNFAILNGIEIELITSNIDENELIPTKSELFQNYPNPFNPETIINYRLSSPQNVELTVFNIMGQKIKTLVRGRQMEGNHIAVWDGKNDQGTSASSGIYFYRLKTDNLLKTKSMLLLR